MFKIYSNQHYTDGKVTLSIQKTEAQAEAYMDMIQKLVPSATLMIVKIGPNGEDMFLAIDPFIAEEIIDLPKGVRMEDCYTWWTMDDYEERRMDV